MRTSYLVSTVSFILAAPFILAIPATAEVWTVMEGTGTPSRGTWKIDRSGSQLNGSGEMTTPRGQRVSFRLKGSVAGDRYFLQRVGSSDGSNCVYRGDMNAKGKIAGSIICDRAATAWLVTRL